jgi:hypothetical protein
MRRAVLVAALCFAPSVSVGAQDFVYAAGTARYRIDFKSTGTSETKGLRHHVGLDAVQHVTATLSERAKDTLALSLTIDSAKIVSSAAGEVDARPMLGVAVKALLSPTGRVYASEPLGFPAQQAFEAAGTALLRFLPELPARAGVGITWHDTTADSLTQMGMLIRRKLVSDYKVLADTLIGSDSAWLLERRAQTTLSGSGSGMGSSLVLEGSGRGSGTILVSKSGRFLSSEFTEELTSKLTIASSGQEVAGSQRQRTVTTLLR